MCFSILVEQPACTAPPAHLSPLQPSPIRHTAVWGVARGAGWGSTEVSPGQWSATRHCGPCGSWSYPRGGGGAAQPRTLATCCLQQQRQAYVIQIKSLNAKTNISIFINLRYLQLKLLKNKENNKKICDIFHQNFKNIPCHVTSELSLKSFYFALFDDGLKKI